MAKFKLVMLLILLIVLVDFALENGQPVPDLKLFKQELGTTSTFILAYISLAVGLLVGWSGGGYGVTIGDTNFKGGLTAIGYGREKGNTQLAIVEETGIIGLLIYLYLLYVLFKRLISEQSKLPRCGTKVLLGIVTGTLFGLIMQSVFEAWWVAPGAPESLYFWTLAGVAQGIASAARKNRILQYRFSNLTDSNKLLIQER